MRKTREILRLKWMKALSHRQVASSLGISAGTVGGAVSRATAAGLDWDQVCEMTDEGLERRLYGPPVDPGSARPEPDFAAIHVERKRPGVTLEVLHLEYLEQHPNGYRYSQFCERYRRWCGSRGLSMRQVHRAGEKAFVDYSGKKPHYVDRVTGEVVECELFVAVLGASSYTFAEATRTQRSEDWIASHSRAFSYFEGVTRLVVPDQLRSGVSRPCRYEPDIQRTYAEWAEHYDVAILPARPRKPRDKAKVEVAVQVVQRWILARLRNERFFSLGELNARILELLDDLNERTMKKYGASRRALFEQIDRPALRPLPAEPFVYGDWSKAKVNIDYHIEIDHHYYSVPHALRGEVVEARISATTVEVFLRGRRVASHARSRRRNGYTTCSEHMPKAHRAHAEWSPSRLVRWAEQVGPQTGALVRGILESRPHPEQGYRTCLGILRLGRKYGEERLERASARAMAVNALSYRHVDTILKNGMDSMDAPDGEPDPQTTLPLHENVRGANYYH